MLTLISVKTEQNTKELHNRGDSWRQNYVLILNFRPQRLVNGVSKLSIISCAIQTAQNVELGVRRAAKNIFF